MSLGESFGAADEPEEEETFKVDWQKQFAQQKQILPRTTEKQSEKTFTTGCFIVPPKLFSGSSHNLVRNSPKTVVSVETLFSRSLPLRQGMTKQFHGDVYEHLLFKSC